MLKKRVYNSGKYLWIYCINNISRELLIIYNGKLGESDHKYNLFFFYTIKKHYDIEYTPLFLLLYIKSNKINISYGFFCFLNILLKL